jgi:TonB-dependent SusC/RagA subfamily outer membrane receptor
MKFKTALLLSFISILCSLQLLAQNVTVTGKVTNRANGEVLPGATVSVKGGQASTQTDANGMFSLGVPGSGAVLLVTYSGMLEQEIPVIPGGSVYNVQLDSRTGSLNEVVVIGYGTQRKANVTGAIASVKAKDLENVPNGRIEQALQGRVSGVTVMQNSGQPGSGSTLRIRGITTFNNNNPLWVVDGVVVDNGGIGYLNQSDIESIEVLKDAASAAIYGTRAATGVILVTTKKGKVGKPVISYNGFYGVSAPAKILELLNATEYATLRNESSVAAGKGIVFPKCCFARYRH